MKNIIVFFTAAFLFRTVIYCQTEEEIILTDTTKECTVYLSDKSVLSGVKLTDIEGTTVKITKDDFVKTIDISKFKTIKFKDKDGFWKGALYTGGALAVATGVLMSITDNHEGGKGWVFIFGSMSLVPGALLGGLVGMMLEEEKIYDMDSDNIKTKIKRLRYIMKENN
jgi:hypothetical protein